MSPDLGFVKRNPEKHEVKLFGDEKVSFSISKSLFIPGIMYDMVRASKLDFREGGVQDTPEVANCR